MNDCDVSIMIENVKLNYRVACILEHNGRVLLNQGKGEDFWNMPGGRVKAGESSENAIKREMQEELNINVKDVKLINVSENFFMYAGKEYHELLHVYSVSFDDNELINKQDFYALDNPNMFYRWFKKEDIKNINCKPVVIYNLINQDKNTITHNVIQDI